MTKNFHKVRRLVVMDNYLPAKRRGQVDRGEDTMVFRIGKEEIKLTGLEMYRLREKLNRRPISAKYVDATK